MRDLWSLIKSCTSTTMREEEEKTVRSKFTTPNVPFSLTAGSVKRGHLLPCSQTRRSMTQAIHSFSCHAKSMVCVFGQCISIECSACVFTPIASWENVSRLAVFTKPSRCCIPGGVVTNNIHHPGQSPISYIVLENRFFVPLFFFSV